jgi:hypothetical protein
MKTEIIYPSPLELKIIKHESLEEAPESVYLTAPSLVKPGEKFSLKIAVVGKNGFAASDCDRLTIESDEIKDFKINVDFQKEALSLCEVQGVEINDKGFVRFHTNLNGKTFYSNPVYCSYENDEKIYWGDPHVHTILSRCNTERCRTLNYCYTAGRHLSQLDWVGAADHVSNGRCDFSKWREQSIVSNLYNDEPDFATLPAYEASLKGSCGGDNNVYMKSFPEMFVDDYESGTPKTLAEGLKEKLPESDFFIVPHHTTRTGKHGEFSDDIYPGKNISPVLEIHSKWGTSEYRGNPNPLKEIHDGPSYANDLLKQGFPFAFIGGTDTHATMPGIFAGTDSPHIDRHPGITAIFASDLSRENVFEAIKNRRCYASSLDRNLILAKINDNDFGTFHPLTDKPIQIKALLAGKSEITRIDLIRNGESIKNQEVNDWKTSFEYNDSDDLNELLLDSPYMGKFVYYYIRATFKNNSQAWTSPAWFCEKTN